MHNSNYLPLNILKFQQKIKDAISKTKSKHDSGSTKKIRLKFSSYAFAKWIRVHNEIEFEMSPNNPNGRFHGCQEHGARIMQNITRIAALIHCINEEEGEISLETLQEAINLGAWYSDNYRALFVKPPQAELDAQMLNQWLNRYRGNNYRSFIRKNFIRQNGPNLLRKKDRLENALFFLQTNGNIRFFASGKTTWINLLPAVQQDILPIDMQTQPQSNLIINSQ